MPVENGATVRVHYTGSLDDGTVFDSSAEREPLEFTLGACEVIPGFEQAVIGLEPGESKEFSLPPLEAYGFRNEALVQPIPRADFEEEPFLGGVVTLVAPDGTEMPGIISKIGDEEVSIDMNHPLAGETLMFEITLVEIVDPTEAAAKTAAKADA